MPHRWLDPAPAPTLAAACAVRLQPFESELDHLELWPRGIVVLAPTTAPAALMDLHQRLAGAVRAQGITLESRPYRPHMTLARHATALIPVVAVLVPVRWRVSRYVLAASSSGRYSVVHGYPARSRPSEDVGGWIGGAAPCGCCHLPAKQRLRPVAAGGRAHGKRHQADIRLGQRRWLERQLYEVLLT